MLLVPLGFWMNPRALQEQYHEVFTGQYHRIHPHWVAPTAHAPYVHGAKPGVPFPCKNGRWLQYLNHVRGGLKVWDPRVRHVQHVVTTQVQPQCYLSDSKSQGQQQLLRACTQTQH